MTAPVDLAPPVLGSLSPSRAGDFLTCPLLFRFRALDRLPQSPTLATSRGTLVHAVLERLFDLPAAQRTVEAAAGLLAPEAQRLRDSEPGWAELLDDDGRLQDWLAGARRLVEAYFALEDPRRLEPARREEHVQVVLPEGLRLRGIVDRVDVAPDGRVRVVDYKTGRAPSPDHEARALFQMRFYALVLWRTTGVVPALLQLMYLGDGQVLRLAPDEQDLLATERTLLALWAAVERAVEQRDFRPRPSRLCDWCDHRDSACPAFGGTLPPWPEDAADRLVASRVLPQPSGPAVGGSPST